MDNIPIVLCLFGGCILSLVIFAYFINKVVGRLLNITANLMEIIQHIGGKNERPEISDNLRRETATRTRPTGETR